MCFPSKVSLAKWDCADLKRCCVRPGAAGRRTRKHRANGYQMKVLFRNFVFGIFIFLFSLWLWSQESGMAPQQPPPSGEATGPAHAAVKDAQHRPITAGGFVDGARVVFADITHQ